MTQLDDAHFHLHSANKDKMSNMNKNYKTLLEKHGYLKIKNILNFDYDLKPILNDMEFVMNELIMKFVSKKLQQKVLKYDFKKKYTYISKLKIITSCIALS